jgi:hypothetical protein
VSVSVKGWVNLYSNILIPPIFSKKGGNMVALILTMGVVAIFVLAFLIDISINMRRVDGNIREMIKKYNKVHDPIKS